MLDCYFCDIDSESPDIIMNQLESIYKSPFKDSLLHPIHTIFAMIASNDFVDDFYNNHS